MNHNIHLLEEDKHKINKLYLKSSAMDDYTNYIYSKCEKTMPSIKKIQKKYWTKICVYPQLGHTIFYYAIIITLLS